MSIRTRDRGWQSLGLLLGCMVLLPACGTKQPGASPAKETRRLEAEFDQAWEATLWTLAERGFEIRRLDRGAGIIETGWLTINPDYTSTVFVTQQEDRYSLCGKPSLGQAYRGKQARLELELRPVRRGEADIQVAAFFRTHRYTDAPLLGDRPRGEVECRSRGRLEDELQIQVQLRAFSAALERLRRGAPQ
jgi:hypothetical protein